jgi:hypothetical protein
MFALRARMSMRPEPSAAAVVRFSGPPFGASFFASDVSAESEKRTLLSLRGPVSF